MVGFMSALMNVQYGLDPIRAKEYVRDKDHHESLHVPCCGNSFCAPNAILLDLAIRVVLRDTISLNIVGSCGSVGAFLVVNGRGGRYPLRID